MKKQLLGLLLFSAAGMANATNWVEYGGNDNFTAYVATDRLSRSGDFIKTWQKWAFQKPQMDKGKPYSYTIVQVDIRCNQNGNNYRFESSVNYAADGSTTSSTPGVSNWDSPPPDSVADHVIAKICGQ